MLKLSIIGCGNVAKTMAYLWHQSGSVEIVDVVNRSKESAKKSIKFIGAGNPLDSIDQLQNADLFVIGSADDDIEACFKDLLKQNVIHTNTIVFHFSGAKSSAVLNEAREFGAKCASLHPVKSFSDPIIAIDTFVNTYCGLEGDKAACEVLTQLIEIIGGNPFKVDGNRKLTYHAASVFACNYMTVLQELSINAFEHSGIERDLAMKILEPIVKETVDNIFQLGTAKALTGPIARGDHMVVKEQFNAVKEWNSDAAELYRLLGKLGVDLSDKKGVSDSGNLNKIKTIFESKN